MVDRDEVIRRKVEGGEWSSRGGVPIPISSTERGLAPGPVAQVHLRGKNLQFGSKGRKLG